MSPDQARFLADVFAAQMENEGKVTTKVLKAVPNDKRDYRPDPKSRTAWEIAVHLATADIWFADSILSGKFEWAGERAAHPELTDPTAVAAWHERELGDRLSKLRAMAPEQMTRVIDFFGTQGPAVTWLTAMNNHTIHHRGQLAAYLRASGSKVPAIYGASADEPLPPA